MSPSSRPAAALLAAAVALALPASLATGQAAPPPAGTVAFVNVTVVPMDREHELAGQTVVVRDGRIAAMGPAGSVAVPAGALRVDGAGKFLMPGLHDMHAHFAPGVGAMSDGAGRQLAMSLAAGVTTIRGMGVAPQNAPAALALRDRVARGEVLGPTMIASGASLNVQSVQGADDARAKVRAAREAGYDLVKTHGGFGADVYDAMAAEAKAVGIPLAGHVTPGFGLDRAMAAGQQIEHLDGFIAKLLPPGVPAPPGQMIVDPALLAAVDESRIPALAREMAERGVYNGPTLALFEVVMSDETGTALAQRPEMRYLPPQAVQQWASQKNMQLEQGGAPAEGRARFLELRRTLVRALHEAGAKLLVGSDGPQFFMTPGYGVHRELEAFVGAGLSPYAALEAATRTPAEYLGLANEVGTVATGKRADLVLLDADPLADVRNAQRIAGVMVGGRWLPGEELERMKGAVEGAVKQ